MIGKRNEIIKMMEMVWFSELQCTILILEMWLDPCLQVKHPADYYFILSPYLLVFRRSLLWAK
jgi:hypothetical protein